jgi:hypothetical protein
MTPEIATSRRRFRQIKLPESQLQDGAYGANNETLPWGPLASLRADPMSLKKRLGIHFHESHDDLDFVKVALLELLPSKRRVALVQHARAPVADTEVHARVDPSTTATQIVTEVAEALEVEPDEFSWQQSD